ncbi:TadE family type IV pilus minor pilin [Microbacterium sp. CJ88]|uniref:TadE family type IV pilus minor pilin n=1 Tax=Microbacterium sp. CJ88 TaxID=3445672 RepID=UPI003F65B9C1
MPWPAVRWRDREPARPEVGRHHCRTGARYRLGERGSAAAEFAVALPAVVIVVLLGAVALGACATQVRLQDAAADAARLAARGDSPARAADAVGAAVAMSTRGDLVCAAMSADAGFGFGVLTATSCALDGGR